MYNFKKVTQAQLGAMMKKAWTGHARRKAPLVPISFKAEVEFHGDKCVPLQIMANKHREAGYHVEMEEYQKEVVTSLAAGVNGQKVQETKLVDFLRVSIEAPMESLAV